MQLSQIIVMMLRYGKCSVSVKLTVFKAYCMCFYDSGLWRNFSRTMINKLHTCYNKSISCAFITSYFKHIIETFCVTSGVILMLITRNVCHRVAACCISLGRHGMDVCVLSQVMNRAQLILL